MRYIVIGTGAIGGTTGGRLAQAGHEALQRLANQAARQRRAPGSITPAEIMALAAPHG